MIHFKSGEDMVEVSRDSWRTTICRLIRAAAMVEYLEKQWAHHLTQVDNSFDRGRQHGQEQVLRLIGRWGKCRPLEGLNGEQMAEALRKVLTPTIVQYTDYKGISQAVADGTFV